MMSLKRVVLVAVLVVLAMPAAALADGVTFGFIGGKMFAVQPANSVGTAGILGTVATNDPSVVTVVPALSGARLYYVSRFSGSTVPSGGVLPPQVAPTYGVFGVFPTPDVFGSMLYTTGPAISTSTTATTGLTTYAAGGSFVVTGNGSIAGTGPTLFTGSFSGPTTLTLIGAPPLASTTCPTCNYWYNLEGPVSGTVDPALLAVLGLGGSGASSGFYFSLILGFIGPDDVVGNPEGSSLSVTQVVPEPGTLALFGTGLIGVAGFIRRRFKA